MTDVDHEKLMEESEYRVARGDFEKPLPVSLIEKLQGRLQTQCRDGQIYEWPCDYNAGIKDAIDIIRQHTASPDVLSGVDNKMPEDTVLLSGTDNTSEISDIDRRREMAAHIVEWAGKEVNGVTVGKVMSFLSDYPTATKPVVSKDTLEKCARALTKRYHEDHFAHDDSGVDETIYIDRTWEFFMCDAKSVLDAAGVPYVD